MLIKSGINDDQVIFVSLPFHYLVIVSSYYNCSIGITMIS